MEAKIFVFTQGVHDQFEITAGPLALHGHVLENLIDHLFSHDVSVTKIAFSADGTFLDLSNTTLAQMMSVATSMNGSLPWQFGAHRALEHLHPGFGSLNRAGTIAAVFVLI